MAFGAETLARLVTEAEAADNQDPLLDATVDALVVPDGDPHCILCGRALMDSREELVRTLTHMSKEIRAIARQSPNVAVVAEAQRSLRFDNAKASYLSAFSEQCCSPGCADSRKEK